MGQDNIAVVIPTRERPDFLARALRSVERQTRVPKEVIVVDDGSPKPLPPEFFSQFSMTVNYRHLSPGRGGPGARNAGIELARAEWIAFLDDDDVWLPEKLSEQMRYISEHPDVDLVYSNYYGFTRDGAVVREYDFSSRFSTDRSLFIERLLVGTITGPTSTYIVRKSALDAVGGMSSDVPTAEDYDLCLKLMHAGFQLGFINKMLVFYQLPVGVQKYSLKTDIKIRGMTAVFEKARRLFPEHSSKLAREIAASEADARVWTYVHAGKSRAMREALGERYRNDGRLLRYLIWWLFSFFLRWGAWDLGVRIKYRFAKRRFAALSNRYSQILRL